MATIYKAVATVEGTSGFSEMQTFVENYWGSSLEEKLYPITFWKLNQLIDVSPTSQAALRVTDFDNRALVDAEWVSYNEDFDELLEGSDRPSEYYFVIDEDLFEEIRSGIPSLSIPINRVLFWGRLGNATTDGSDFTAFIMSAETDLIPPGSSGPGTIAGAKIPPP